jgi:oligopeptide/dipeptide ABC transporter ATP-binding protein
MSGAPLLEAVGLVKRYRVAGRTVEALRGVSLAIAEGETLGLLGESGCGKSTLGRCLLRLEEPDEGELRFAGAPLRGARALAALRRRTGLVFQDPFASLDPRMRIERIVAEPLAIHRVGSRRTRRARVAELLAQVGLPKDALSRYPHEFSGGQRQRIGIARALALEPSLVIADEPLSALDVGVQAQVANLLGELGRRHRLSLLLISHDVRLVLHLSRRVAVMYLGRIVELAPAAELAARPRHPYTRALLGAVPSFAAPGAGGEALAGEPPSPSAPPTGCTFHPRCPVYAARRGAACRDAVPALEPVGPAHVSCHERDAPMS